MKKRVGLLIPTVVVLGCVIGALRPSPIPTDVRIVPPAAALAPCLAGLSGVWEAAEGRPRQIVVEQINETWAKIVQAWPDETTGWRGGRWERTGGHILRDGTVLWGYPERFTLRMAAAGAVLEREGIGAPERIPLRKVRAFDPRVTTVADLGRTPEGSLGREFEAK